MGLRRSHDRQQLQEPQRARLALTNDVPSHLSCVPSRGQRWKINTDPLYAWNTHPATPDPRLSAALGCTCLYVLLGARAGVPPGMRARRSHSRKRSVLKGQSQAPAHGKNAKSRKAGERRFAFLQSSAQNEVPGASPASSSRSRPVPRRSRTRGTQRPAGLWGYRPVGQTAQKPQACPAKPTRRGPRRSHRAGSVSDGTQRSRTANSR